MIEHKLQWNKFLLFETILHATDENNSHSRIDYLNKKIFFSAFFYCSFNECRSLYKYKYRFIYQNETIRRRTEKKSVNQSADWESVDTQKGKNIIEQARGRKNEKERHREFEAIFVYENCWFK